VDATLAPFLGLAVGLVLALTGAGGAIIAVPLLVFGLHMSLAQAGPVALLSVTLASAVGAALGFRERVLRYKAAGLMASAGIVLSPLGLWLAHRLPDRPLNAIFAVVLVAVAWRMLSQASRDLRGIEPPRRETAPCLLDPAIGKLHWTWRCARALVAAGAAAGFLSGLLGVGGGFIIVPTLLAMSNLPMKSVTTTSMCVVAIVCAAGVVNAAVAGVMPWPVALPFAAGALAGLLVGRWFAGRLAGPRLQQGFAVLSFGVALGLLAKAALQP